MADRAQTIAPGDWAGPLHERPGLFLRRWQVDGEPVHPEHYLRAMAELPADEDPDAELIADEPDDDLVLPEAGPMWTVDALAEVTGPGVPSRGGPRTIVEALDAKRAEAVGSPGSGWAWQVSLGRGWTAKGVREGGYTNERNGRLTGYTTVRRLFRTGTCALRLQHVNGLRAVALWGANSMAPVLPVSGVQNGLEPVEWSSAKYLGGWAWRLDPETGRAGDTPTSVPARCFTPRCWESPHGRGLGLHPCQHVRRPAGWPWVSDHRDDDHTVRRPATPSEFGRTDRPRRRGRAR
jgi:hypothetical protein